MKMIKILAILFLTLGLMSGGLYAKSSSLLEQKTIYVSRVNEDKLYSGSDEYLIKSSPVLEKVKDYVGLSARILTTKFGSDQIILDVKDADLPPFEISNSAARGQEGGLK